MFTLPVDSGYLIYLAGIAGLLHACLQMPLAGLLHMAGHTLGKDQRHKAFGLSMAMSLGVLLTVCVLLIIAVYAAKILFTADSRFLVPGVLAVFAGLFVMLAYFREGAGAQLWLPRGYSRWFRKQSEHKVNLPTAFSMGIVAVLSELVLAFPLLLSAGALLTAATISGLLIGLSVYTFIVALPLLLASLGLAGGMSPLGLQRWRLEGKRFWQFFIGLTFIFFGLYIASEQFVYLGTPL